MPRWRSWICYSNICNTASRGRLDPEKYLVLNRRSLKHHFSTFSPHPKSELCLKLNDGKHNEPIPAIGQKDPAPLVLSDVVGEELRELSRVNPEEAKDVFIDDLSATLEAHRATNRATLVRKLNQSARWIPPFKILSLKSKAIGEPTTKNDSMGQSIRAADKASREPSKASEIVVASVSGASEKIRDSALVNDAVKNKSKGGRAKDSGRNTRPWINWPADSVQNERGVGKKYKCAASEVLEYKPMYIAPRGDYRSSNSPECPWVDGLDDSHARNKADTAYLRLNAEIKAYEKYMKPSVVEEEAARLLIASVTSIVGKKFRDKPIDTIGSHSTGLADRLSDFDLALSVPDLEKSPLERGPSPTRPLAVKARRTVLWGVYKTLSQSEQFRDMEYISARVPIVRAIHRNTHWKLDIQTLGPHQATRECILYYLAEFPTLRPLYIIFRSALHLRQLNIVHEGGLGSYSIFIMIVNALKHALDRYATDDLVNHFLYILDFYSNANLYKYGYSPDRPYIFEKQQKKKSADEKIAHLQDPMLCGLDVMRKFDPRKPYLLCLQDPANPVNDLGRKAYGIKHVQKLFSVVRRGLAINMKAWERDGSFEQPWHSRALLAPLLAANYTTLEEKRHRIEDWVAEEHPSFLKKIQLR